MEQPDSPNQVAVDQPNPDSPELPKNDVPESPEQNEPEPPKDEQTGLQAPESGAADNKLKGAIVVLTHGQQERILLLDRAIQSADKAFNSRLGYPYVVFTGVR